LCLADLAVAGGCLRDLLHLVLLLFTLHKNNQFPDGLPIGRLLLELKEGIEAKASEGMRLDVEIVCCCVVRSLITILLCTALTQDMWNGNGFVKVEGNVFTSDSSLPSAGDNKEAIIVCYDWFVI
jgi:hypothetical protein